MSASHEKDMQDVTQAVLDYVEGTYLVDASRVERSVHPDLTKVGFVWHEGDYAEFRTSKAELVEMAGSYNRDGQIPLDSTKNVTVFEVQDKTATAKLEAWWGIDYLHLVKLDGTWLIMNVMWQTHPPTE